MTEKSGNDYGCTITKYLIIHTIPCVEVFGRREGAGVDEWKEEIHPTIHPLNACVNPNYQTICDSTRVARFYHADSGVAMNDLIILGTSVHAAEMAEIVEHINWVETTWNLLGFIMSNEQADRAGGGNQRVSHLGYEESSD